MKVGIIRCKQTEDLCPGTTDFKFASNGKGIFTETGPVEIVGFIGCGGCPGKRAVSRVKIMIQRGAEAIVFASCVSKGTPIGMPCPHFSIMREAITRNIPAEIKLFDWTH